MQISTSLRAINQSINQICTDIHPTVPNPYALLTSVPETNSYLTVLALKDAFSCIPIDKQSQTIFAYVWENLYDWKKDGVGQCSLKDSKIRPLYLVVLAKEVEQWKKGNSVPLLQPVDDILVGADKEQTCLKVIISLGNFLGLAGISRKKKVRPIS